MAALRTILGVVSSGLESGFGRHFKVLRRSYAAELNLPTEASIDREGGPDYSVAMVPALAKGLIDTRW